jgi:hypothetical protein
MRKNQIAIAVASACLLGGSAFAAAKQPKNWKEGITSGHFGIQTALNVNANVSSHPGIGIGYFAPNFAADLNLGYFSNRQKSTVYGEKPFDENVFNLIGHIGGRYPLGETTKFTAGIKGKYVYDKSDDKAYPAQTKQGWGAGIYIGFDQQLSKQLQLSFKIDPYFHRRYSVAFKNKDDASTVTGNMFFSTGSVTLTYLFN